nr:Gfo/Idh/MocA family oxidoreductase [Clostridia bacterium]
MKKIGYCVAGLGIGKAHVAAAASNPNVDYLVICDIDETRLAQVGEKYPQAVRYISFEKMLEDPRIDIVSVALPSGMHAEYAVKALKAGKNVLCEKPIDITVEKALTIEAARVETGKKVGVIFQNRNNAVMREAKKAVEEGKLGKLILGTFAVKWYRNQKYYDDGGWRGTWEMD